jgi:RNA polymerase sigma factor (sigma-70 family)
MPVAEYAPDALNPDSGTADLVAAACRRDPGAWEELMARYGALVRGVVASYRLQDADASDAVQMTWLRAFERMESLRDPDRLGGWLATIAGRECLALMRRSRRETPDDAVAGECVAVGPGPEALVLVEEARGAVRAAVATLTGRRRQLVHALFYLPERDYASLAQDLGMPVGSIGPTRGRLLRSLRSTLEPAGYGAARHSTDGATDGAPDEGSGDAGVAAACLRRHAYGGDAGGRRGDVPGVGAGCAERARGVRGRQRVHAGAC